MVFLVKVLQKAEKLTVLLFWESRLPSCCLFHGTPVFSSGDLIFRFLLFFSSKHTGHCHIPFGMALSGGFKHSMWYTNVHVSQHNKSPPLPHTWHSDWCWSTMSDAMIVQPYR